MKVQVKIAAVILLLILCRHIAAAQEVSYRQISINEGLPSSEVYSIIQDRKGYIWTSTDAGVCRFNGRKFTCFTTADGLKDNTVFNLFEDRKGRIWMICYNGAVCYYENGKISSISASDTLLKKLKNEASVIYSSVIDSKDTLWLGTNRVLLKIPPEQNYKHVTRDISFDNSATTIIKTFNNKSAVISQNFTEREVWSKNIQISKTLVSSIFECKGEYQFRYRIYKEIKLTSTPLQRCIYLRDGRLLFSHMNDLYIYSPENHVTKKPFENRIIFLKQDKNNDLVIGFSKGGAYKYYGSDLSSIPVKYFTDKSVSGVLTDHEGGTWFSTLESGVYYIPMRNYSTYKSNTLLNEKICGLDAIENKVFISNNKNQILMISRDNTINWLRVSDAISAARATKFYHYNNTLFVVGNAVGKIDTINKEVFFFYTSAGTRTTGLSLVPLDHDEYLIASNFYSYKLKNGIVLTGSKEREKIIADRATSMIKTQNGVIYLGTRNGVYRYSEERFIRAFQDDSTLLQSITCMEEDNQGRLLLGTKEKGILVLKNDQHKAIGTLQGVPSDICTAILPDTNETIWVGTNKGIALLKIGNNDSISVIATINTSHGLSSNEITRLARRGKILYVGTKEGLCEIDVSQPFHNTTPPPVFISSVYVNKTIAAEVNSAFQYDQNNFRFYIDCLSYKDMFSPSYYYRLKGQDSTLQLSSAEFIDFSNLRPGNYRLEVWGLNNNKVLSTTPAIYNFSIAKPFWLKWWFILAEVMAGAAIVFLFIRIRLKDIRKKEEEKTKLNRMIAESQMTALRSQMNPHFIFNAINSIQNYILKQNTQQAYDYLTKFSKLIRMVLNNSKENMITIEQELATLSLYIEMEQLRFDKSFDFEINFDKKIDLENCLIPGMLLQPFVENAIWHGIMPLEGIKQGKITLNVRSDAESLSISIEDNGIGREKSKLINKSATHRSIGMMLSQNRMTILNQARKDKVYNILIEDLYNDKKQPAGTKIIVTIPTLIQDEN